MTPRGLIEPARLAGSTLLRTQSDARLVDLTRDGNDRAFEAIVQRYRRPLLRYCTRMLPAARAEDAVQQAFLSAYTAIRSGGAELTLKPWLYRIAHNATVNALRQNGWTHEQLDESIDGVERPDQAVERRERFGEVVLAVQALPERQRDALVLREFEGRTYDEIASTLDVSDGAVRQLLNRARTTLRAAAAAFVPPDLVARLAMRGEPVDSIGGRIADICAGAGGAAAAAKVGAAVVLAGAVAGSAANAPLPGLGGSRGDGSPTTPLVAEANAATPALRPARLVAGHGSGTLVGDDRDRPRRRGRGASRRHEAGSGGDGGNHRGRRGTDDNRTAEPRDGHSGDGGGETADDREHLGGDSSGPGSGGSGDSDDSVSLMPATTTDDSISSNSGPSGSSGSGSSGGSDDFTSSGTEPDGH